MPYDPNLPLENTLIDAAQMRAQQQGLNDLIQARATPAQVAAAEANAIGNSSNNSNGVATMGMVVSDPPTQSEVQAIADKLDELINALRR